MLTLSNSIRLYARPDIKEQLLEFFTNVPGLQGIVSSDAVGSPEPIYAFVFSPVLLRRRPVCFTVIACCQQATRKIHVVPGQGNG